MYRHDQSSSSSSSGYYVTTEQGEGEINRLLSWGGDAEASGQIHYQLLSSSKLEVAG